MKDNLSTADWIASPTGCARTVWTLSARDTLLCKHLPHSVYEEFAISYLPSCPRQMKWNNRNIKVYACNAPTSQSGPSSHHISALPDHEADWGGGGTLLGGDSSAFFSPLIYILDKQGYNDREGHSFTLNFWIFNCWSMKWQLHRITFYGKKKPLKKSERD